MRSTLPISTAVVDLTPRRPVPMGGFSGPERLSIATEGRLEANIVAVGEDKTATVFVSLDTLFVGAALRDSIIRDCGERFGVGPECVLVLASHTHFAPMLDASKPTLGRTDAEETDRWMEKIGEAIAAAEAKPATSVRAGCGHSDASVNRRLRWPLPSVVRLLGKSDRDVYMCDNPAGPRDPRIRTWTWLSPDGYPVAALWTFACHPVFYPHPQTASPDYIGRVREALRARLGAKLPVIFAPGCMGDIWPRSPKAWKQMRRILPFLIYGPSPVPYDMPQWERWANELAGEVSAADAAGFVRPITEKTTAGRLERLRLDAFFDGHSPVPDLTAKAVDVPGVGRLVTLSCEPVAEIAGVFAEGPNDLVLGYEGDVFGYLPTDAMIAEGGYEPRLSHRPFGLKGAFRPHLDERLTRFAETLKADETLPGSTT